MKKIKILFLCIGNSVRSQIAEGWARALKADEIEVFSAGIEEHGVNPLAVKVMAESGIDISQQKSKLVTDILDIDFDYVITLCPESNEKYLPFSGETKLVYTNFTDPSKIKGMYEAKLEAFRQARDSIKEYILLLPETLEE